MELKYFKQISGRLKISESSVFATLKLLEQGNTIPFIARYRKEITNNLDETQILDIKNESCRLVEIDSRRETILKEIERQGKLTPELKKMIEETEDSAALEDIYLPFKPKRKTKATVAKEMGLEPLAELIFSQKNFDINKEAEKYLNDSVKDTESALEGAGYIIAEWVNEDKTVRESVRSIFEKGAVVYSTVIKGMEEQGAKYRDYFNFSEPLSKISSHRFLAIKRAENENILKVSIYPGESDSIEVMEKLLVLSGNQASEFVKIAIRDCYKRLLCPSLETEFTNIAKQKADGEAIRVFADNLRQLLLAPFLGRKKILAIDPGFRTGCKVVCLNEQGDLLFNDTIYPHPPVNKMEESAKKMKEIVSKYEIEVIAIGNGTASRETSQFINIFFEDTNIKVFIVSESGASIYSASPVAREEFPDHDVTVRGAVSIGRRLMDPLAELVKIDPKSIGVGQYQHDVDQSKLKESLDYTVESCVNMVGVNLNTASKHLLMYVSGLGPKIAQNIIEYRKENGAFLTRNDLKKVPKVGEKIFEQCAGFLRIEDGKNPLDSSAVHPESYYVVEKIAQDLGIGLADIVGNGNIKDNINLSNYVDDKTGILTLRDILLELAKPGRDPRENVDDFEFKKDILSIDDLKAGMILNGIINNITNFGAFVDIGIKEYGLIHISELSHKFIKNPHEVVKINQKVNVRIIDVDYERKRISMSLKQIS
ncbi:MAG: Tex family protein [Actinomycetota bacterium]|nr:Tex family protein [Actinomycetota bacterium]